MGTRFQNAVALIASYTNTARGHSRHASPLAAQLRAAAPRDLTVDQRHALEQIVAASEAVDDIAKLRQRTSPPAVRGPRNSVVTGWTSMFQALTALSSCAPEVGSTGAEAARLLETLFPEGVTFSLDDAPAVWSSSRVILSRIEDEGLAARIDALLHPAMRASVVHAHAQLGAAIGVDGRAASFPSTHSLAEASSRFAFAVSAYARAMSVRLDPSDATAMDRFANVLSPIDSFRVNGKVEEEESEEPGVPGPVAPTPGDPTPPPPFANA
jgi:hypothetical protein